MGFSPVLPVETILIALVNGLGSDSQCIFLSFLACCSACQELDGCAKEPCGCGGDGCLEVLCEAAVAVQPGEGSLDDPSAGQRDEAFRNVELFDEFDCPVAGRGEGVAQFVTGIAAIGEDMAQFGIALGDFGQHPWRTVAVLNISRVNDSMDKVAAGVGQDMALPSFHFLTRVIAPNTAGFYVLRLWGFDALAVDHTGTGTPALGPASHPPRPRAAPPDRR